MSHYDHATGQATQTTSVTKPPTPYELAIERLFSTVQGEVILPDDPDYDTARAVWNGTIDRRPAVIVRCADADDVKAAVHFARNQALTLSVRSAGHSVPGHGTNDDGVVIDLSNMKTITVDPIRRTARLEPGLTWKEVSNALEPFGLALTSGDTGSVGVGGLLLGGGIGWMLRSQGLTIDHLRAVELVTADGRLLRASADEHPELFWGVRGGGGNFGVATAFELDLHAGGTILGGAVFYDAAEAERILNEYARLATAAPDELTTSAALMLAPPAPFIPAGKQGTPVVAIMVCYTGDPAEGEQVVAPLRQLATPIADTVAPMPYPGLFALTEVGEIQGFQHHARSLFVDTISDGLSHAVTQAAQAVMSPATLVQLRVLGGAMSRVAPDATAFAHRDKQGMVLITHFGPTTLDPADLEARTRHVYNALAAYRRGVYVGFLADQGEQGIREAYPPSTYARLVALKNQYDPTNLFQGNQNINPTV